MPDELPSEHRPTHCSYCGGPLEPQVYFCHRCAKPYKHPDSMLPVSLPEYEDEDYGDYFTSSWGPLLFTCIPLIIILCLSNLKQEEARWNAAEVEQRRLREQLRQEQMKNEALRQHTVARLDQHDQALGVDTRQTAPALTMSGQFVPPPLVTTSGAPPPDLPAENWYTAEDNTQQGPFTFALLHARARQGTLPPECLVWVQGMDEWKPAREVSGLFSA